MAVECSFSPRRAENRSESVAGDADELFGNALVVLRGILLTTKALLSKQLPLPPQGNSEFQSAQIAAVEIHPPLPRETRNSGRRAHAQLALNSQTSRLTWNGEATTP